MAVPLALFAGVRGENLGGGGGVESEQCQSLSSPPSWQKGKWHGGARVGGNRERETDVRLPENERETNVLPPHLSPVPSCHSHPNDDQFTMHS